MRTFDDFGLILPLRQALIEAAYATPTPIQIQAIPPALQGRDILGCAQTGTGKTAAFALPVLQHLGTIGRKAAPQRPLVLVLAPTRELAIQIERSFAGYGRYLKVRRALIYGGVGQAAQVQAMARGSEIVIATPGRLLDLMNQGHVRLDQIELFVLDEADRMLDMGFLPDLKRIISRLPRARQSFFFSATMPDRVCELARQLLDQPVRVDVTPESISVATIRQQVFHVERKEKCSLLHSLLERPEVDQAIVFTRTKRGANQLAKTLHQWGITSAALHGNKSQNARQQALHAFRQRSVRVLVATDLAARGIDISGITHVINFDLPEEPESYVHRIGRTGRAGADGTAYSFCTSAERPSLRAIEQLIAMKVTVMAGGDPLASNATDCDASPRVTQPAARPPAAHKPAPRRSRAGSRDVRESRGEVVPGGAEPRSQRRQRRRAYHAAARQSTRSAGSR